MPKASRQWSCKQKEAVGSGKYMKAQNTDECLKKDWEIGNLQISES